MKTLIQILVCFLALIFVNVSAEAATNPRGKSKIRKSIRHKGAEKGTSIYSLFHKKPAVRRCPKYVFNDL